MDESVRGQGLPSPQEVCLSSYVINMYLPLLAAGFRNAFEYIRTDA